MCSVTKIEGLGWSNLMMVVCVAVVYNLLWISRYGQDTVSTPLLDFTHFAISESHSITLSLNNYCSFVISVIVLMLRTVCVVVSWSSLSSSLMTCQVSHLSKPFFHLKWLQICKAFSNLIKLNNVFKITTYHKKDSNFFDNLLQFPSTSVESTPLYLIYL